MNGPLFVQAILRPYMEFMGKTDYEPYLQSLVVDLNSLKKLHPLQRCEVLDSMAKSYAKWSGRHWIIGHVKFIERFGVLIEDGKLVGENCSYGISSAIGVVMQLLVDEGVRSLGHRENILDPAFNKIGVGFAPHGRYKTNCVLEFSD
jgi:uncharacterized protein YkwD